MRNNLKTYFNIIIRMFLSIVSAISICLKVTIPEKYHATGLFGRVLELFDVGLDGNVMVFSCVLVLVLLLCFRLEKLKDRSKWISYVLAAIFSIFTVIGKSYASLNSWDYLFHDFYQFIFALFVLSGYSIFFYSLCRWIFELVDKGVLSEKESKDRFEIRRGTFWKIYLIIFLCWIPYLLVFYPGSVPYDGYYQLNMFYGYNPASNHHPWLSTLVIGGITAAGRIISDNFGVFLYILMQSLFCTFTFTAVCCKIMTYTVAQWFKVAVVLYFAILPVWGAYAQTLMKDVMYYGIFALFGIFYIEFFEKKACLSKKKMVAFLITGCLLVQYRNEGIYIIGVSVFLLLFAVQKRKIGMILAFIMIFHVAFNSFVLPFMGVSEGSKKEMLSVPFQQTARYVSLYENELTNKEIDIIDHVLSYSVIKEKYNPINSDPVKNSFRHPSKQSFMEYVKVWLHQFKKHPSCYIQATLNNCFGYFYPGYIQNSISNMQFYIKGEPLATGDLNIHYVHANSVRNVLANYSLLWFKLPGISLLLYPGTYTWLLLICFGTLMRDKKYKECIAGSLPLFTIAICLISPVNGYLRYMLPVMVFMPLMVAFTINSVWEGNIEYSL